MNSNGIPRQPDPATPLSLSLMEAFAEVEDEGDEAGLPDPLTRYDFGPAHSTPHARRFMDAFTRALKTHGLALRKIARRK